MPATAIAEPEYRVAWEPNPGSQYHFINCPFWEVLADGDRGGGKSKALVASYLFHVDEGFGSDWRGIIFRRTYPELIDLIDYSRELIADIFPKAVYNKSEHTFEFHTGEKLMFRHLDNMQAYRHYHGMSVPFLGFDELTTWPSPEPYEAMLSCSRPPTSNKNIPLKVRSTTNSWGLGFDWVKRRFITGKIPYQPYGEVGLQRVRIPIRWQDNLRFIEADPQYHKRIEASITNEAQRKAWLENSWDIVAGGRFSDVWKESVHFIEPFNIPSRWIVDRSFDWGSSKPFATLWYAESNGESLMDGRSWPKGTLFVIAEDYGCAGDMNDANWKPNVGLGLDPTEIARRIKEREEDMLKWGMVAKKPRPGPADLDLFDVSRGTSMAKQMSTHNVVWQRASKGPGSRVTGWQLIEGMLKASLKHPMEEPGLFIFNTCVHLRRTLPILPRDAKNPDDLDSSSEDHLLDSLRYRVISGKRGPVVRGVTL